MKRYMIAIYIALAVLALLFVLFTALNRVVVATAEGAHIIECEQDTLPIKKYEAIVVLGAGVREDGTPSHMLEDRLRGAVSLYERGAADKIILSGDRSGDDYDEVSAMERYCLQAGIPPEAMIRDDIGFSTYETMFNTVKTGGYKSIIVVTQKYHLYRAMYIGIKMGAEVDGFAADYRSYRGQLYRNLREYVARAKDLVKVSVK